MKRYKIVYHYTRFDCAENVREAKKNMIKQLKEYYQICAVSKDITVEEAN